MGDIITVKQRNIEELGFPEELHGQADGLFLDLPGPWHVSLWGCYPQPVTCLIPDIICHLKHNVCYAQGHILS